MQIQVRIRSAEVENITGELMSEPVTKKTYDYAAFIDEIKTLRDEALQELSNYTDDGIQALREEQLDAHTNGLPFEFAYWSANSSEFKLWHAKLARAIQQGQRLSNEVKLSDRDFITLRDVPLVPMDNQVERQRAMKSDLEGTARELTLMIKEFEKYGPPHDPTVNQIIATPAGMDPKTFFPDKPTLLWLSKHMPVSWWGTIGGGLLLICGATTTAAFYTGKFFGEHAVQTSPSHEGLTTNTASNVSTPPALPAPATSTPTIPVKPTSGP